MSKSNIAVNGKIQTFEIKPTLSYDRTMVPMRSIFELLGATVVWDDSSHKVTANIGKNLIEFSIGSRKVTVNKEDMFFEVKPQLYQNTTMVPLRFITETLGATLDWDDATSTINIKTN